ncbi:MAG: GntR family transcriptional regulator [Streptosporangiaceae bacterium]
MASNEGARGRAPRAPSIPRPRHLTLAEFVLDEIRQRIVLGRLEPGARIEVDKLAEDLGSSRIPVREAVRRLEAEGLVVSIPRRGVIVTEVHAQDIDDAYELLESVELLAAQRAVKSATPEVLGTMRYWADEMDRLVDLPRSEEMLVAHRSFHFAMFETVGEGILLRHLRMLWHACERFLAASMPDPERAESAHREHGQLIELLDQRDVAGLTGLIRHHLRASCERAHRRLE